MTVVNKPEVSRLVAWPYFGLALFIAASIMFFIYAGFFTPMGSLGIVAAAVVVEAVIWFLARTPYPKNNQCLRTVES